MNGQEEVDEFGIPIKKKAPESKKQEVDEFGIPIKKKEPTGQPSANGTEPTSPSKSPSPSVGRTPTGIPITRRNKPTQTENVVLDPAGQAVRKSGIAPIEKQKTIPTQDEEFVQQGEMVANPNQLVNEVAQMEVAPDEVGTAIEIAKKTSPNPVPLDQELLSEEIKQTTAEITIPEEYKNVPQQEEVIIAEKFKSNPDGTVRISEDYYGVTRKGNEVVVEGGQATETETLAAKGFYYNTQNKKTGDYPELFGADPSEGFSQYEPEITAYFDRLKSASPEKYADVKRKIEAGNFTQEDQYEVLANIEANKIEKGQRDLRIAQYRASQGEEGYEDYIAEKKAELDIAYQTVTELHNQFPVVAEKMWKQEVLTKRWKEAEGAGAIMPWLTISGAKTNNMLMGVVNGTGQFLTRTAGLYNTADSWNQFWEDGILTVPETPIIEEDGSINITNATTEIIPQLAQMYLVFSKGAAGINQATGMAVESNFGLFTAGFLATYKDLYDQAKEADLSDADANLYANIVGIGVAGAELIMPDRNFFATQSDDYLRFMIQESAKGTKGKALQNALTKYISNTAKENVQEFTQDFVSNAGAVITDAAVDGANFDAELFSKEGIINTAVVTTMVAGLAGSGGLVQDLTKRRKDIYQLSQNYEKFQEQTANLVETGVITPEQAQTLTQEVDKIVEAEGKVPPQMTPEKKSEVVPMVAEKEKLEEEKKNLDPVFQPPVQEKIDALNEKIIEVTQKEEAPSTAPAVGDDIRFRMGSGEFVKEQDGKIEEIREDGSYKVTLKVGGEETTTIVKPQNIITNAVKEGVEQQDNIVQREGVDGQQQGEQEDRKDQKEPIQETKTETGGSNSVIESGQVQEEVKVEGVVGQKESPSVQEEVVQEVVAEEKTVGEKPKVITNKEDERAKSFGYSNPFQAVQSVNKNLGKEYTVDQFNEIPDAEFKEAAKSSKTVQRNKVKEETLAKIQTERADALKRISEKMKGKLSSGIDPSIIPDLIALGKTYVDEGIVKAADFIARMREDLRAIGVDDTKISDEDITSQIYEPIKPKEQEKPKKGKVVESGRSKTVTEGRMPIANEEMRKRLLESPHYYERYGNKNALDDAENFFSQFGEITTDNWSKVSDALKAVDLLSNPWLLVARDIHAANGFTLAEKAFKAGNEEDSTLIADSAINFFNKTAEIALQLGKQTGNLSLLRVMNVDNMMIFFTRTLNRAFDESSVLKRRRNRAKKDIAEIKNGMDASQRQTASKMAEGVRSGKIAPEVKRKSKGKNPDAYKPRIEEANAKINKGLDLLKKSAANMTINGISPEGIEGIKLIIEGLIIKGSVNVGRIYARVRNDVNDYLKQDLSREDFDKIYEESGLEEVRKEVEKQKLEGDKYLKSKVKEEIAAQDILAELTYDYYSGAKKGTEGLVESIQEKLGLTEAEAKSIKGRLDAIFEQILTEENKKMLRKKFRQNKRATPKKVDDAAKKFAEYVQAGVLDEDYMLDQLSELYEIDSLTSEDIIKLKELSEKYFRAKIFKDEVAKEIADFISSRVPVSAFNVYQGFWYASVLSGVGTQITNIYGNMNLMIGEFSVNKVADAIGAVTRKDGTIHAPNKLVAKRLIATVNTATNMVLEVFRNGATSNKYMEENSSQFSKQFTVERLDQYKGGNKVSAFAKKIIRGVYTPVKFILRGLEAFDQGFGSLSFDSEANTLLRRKYFKEGLRGKDLQNAVYNDLFGSDVIKQESYEEVIAEMIDLGMDVSDKQRVRKGVVNAIREKLDPEIRSEANKFAAKVTLKGAPTGVAGMVAKGITSINNSVGFTRFIIPFVNVPFNMLNRWIDWVPAYGLARAYGIGLSAVLERKSPDTFTRLGVQPSKAVNKREIEQAWARQILSMALASGVYALTQMTYTDDDGEEKPILEFSGGRTYLDFKDRIDAEKYMPEYSFRFMGGIPFSYKLAPVAPYLLFFGESRDRELFKEDRTFERTTGDKAVLYGMIGMKFFLDAAPLQGLQNLWESIDKFATSSEQESTKLVNLVGKSLVKQGTTLLEPNLYGQMMKIFDPKSYTPQDISEMIYKGLNISFLNEDATYYFDGFGRAIKYYPSEKYFPVQHIFQGKGEDKVDLLMVEKNISPSTLLSRAVPYKTEIIEYNSETNKLSSYKAEAYKKKYKEYFDKKDLGTLGKEEFIDALKAPESEIPNLRFITTKQWQDISIYVGKAVYADIEKYYNEVKALTDDEAKDYIKKRYEYHYDAYVADNWNLLDGPKNK